VAVLAAHDRREDDMGDMVDKIESKVFGKIDSAGDLLTFKLGEALAMENTVLKMLGKLEQEAQRRELKDLLSHHADETRSQIENLERAFAALGAEADEKPCLPMTAIDKQGSATIKLADERLVDIVILGGSAQTEHHEIAVYESLITLAGAMDKQDVVSLLRENLQQEEHTLEEASGLMAQIVEELTHQTA
jgi:ferritin-like metal-binding protein YciE